MSRLMKMPPQDWNKLVDERPSSWWSGGVPIRKEGYDAFMDRHEESTNVERRQQLRPWGFKRKTEFWEHGGSMGWQQRKAREEELEATQKQEYGGELGDLQRASLGALGTATGGATSAAKKVEEDARSGRDFNWSDWNDTPPRIQVGIKVRGPRGTQVTKQDFSGVVDQATVTVDRPTASAQELEE